jgi:ferric-dicitrate binding protein FerR (iron transport regulator)
VRHLVEHRICPPHRDHEPAGKNAEDLSAAVMLRVGSRFSHLFEDERPRRPRRSARRRLIVYACLLIGAVALAALGALLRV